MHSRTKHTYAQKLYTCNNISAVFFSFFFFDQNQTIVKYQLIIYYIIIYKIRAFRRLLSLFPTKVPFELNFVLLLSKIVVKRNVIKGFINLPVLVQVPLFSLLMKFKKKQS